MDSTRMRGKKEAEKKGIRNEVETRVRQVEIVESRIRHLFLFVSYVGRRVIVQPTKEVRTHERNHRNRRQPRHR